MMHFCIVFFSSMVISTHGTTCRTSLIMGNLLVKAELFMTAYHHNRYTVIPIDCETNEIVSEILKWYFLVGFCSVIICYIPVLVFVVFVATIAQ
jgi:hypothetical protein